MFDDNLLIIFNPHRSPRVEKCPKIQYLERRESVLLRAGFSVKGKVEIGRNYKIAGPVADDNIKRGRLRRPSAAS